MKPYYADDAVTVYAGDCLDVLRELPDASVDSVCTDPPYGIRFMGKAWDGAEIAARAVAGKDHTKTRERSASMHAGEYDLSPSANQAFQLWCTEWATECLRVLKPGGHLLAFGGSRTWHRLAAAVEDAGFEIRDSIFWIYASGFPKSLNVSKALTEKGAICLCDKGESERGSSQRFDAPEQECAPDLSSVWGDVPSVPDEAKGHTSSGVLASVSRQTGRGPTGRDSQDGLVGLGDGTAAPNGTGQPGVEGRRDLQAPEGELHRPEVRQVPTGVPGDGTQGRLHHGAPAGNGTVGRSSAVEVGSGEPHQPRPEGQPARELGAVPEQRGPQAWGGWPVCERCAQPVIPDGLGTALKPSAEPIVVGRKPLAGTVAANVLAHGTGALNVDGCRVGTSGATRAVNHVKKDDGRLERWDEGYRGARNEIEQVDAGRWPTNVVLDDSQAAELDRQSGTSTSPPVGSVARTKGGNTIGTFAHEGRPPSPNGHGDSGGASRFFPTFRYEPKAPQHERPREGTVAHPTVKPLDLMRWLVRLVTPPGGTVLDPFAGSGTTAEACVIEHLRCITIEREVDYLPLIVARLTKPIQVGLDFEGLGA